MVESSGHVESKRVVLSITETEFVALSSAYQEALWLHRILDDIKHPVGGAITIYEDNQSCLKLIEEEKLSSRIKHIDTMYHFVKNFVNKGDAMQVLSNKGYAGGSTHQAITSTLREGCGN